MLLILYSKDIDIVGQSERQVNIVEIVESQKETKMVKPFEKVIGCLSVAGATVKTFKEESFL